MCVCVCVCVCVRVCVGIYNIYIYIYIYIYISVYVFVARGDCFKPGQKILKLNSATMPFGLAYLGNELRCLQLDIGVAPVTPALAV